LKDEVNKKQKYKQEKKEASYNKQKDASVKVYTQTIHIVPKCF